MVILVAFCTLLYLFRRLIANENIYVLPMEGQVQCFFLFWICILIMRCIYAIGEQVLQLEQIDAGRGSARLADAVFALDILNIVTLTVQTLFLLVYLRQSMGSQEEELDDNEKLLARTHSPTSEGTSNLSFRGSPNDAYLLPIKTVADDRMTLLGRADSGSINSEATGTQENS